MVKLVPRKFQLSPDMTELCLCWQNVLNKNGKVFIGIWGMVIYCVGEECIGPWHLIKYVVKLPIAANQWNRQLHAYL